MRETQLRRWGVSLIGHDKSSLDIFWIRDGSAKDSDNLEAAAVKFWKIPNDLASKDATGEKAGVNSRKDLVASLKT